MIGIAMYPQNSNIGNETKNLVIKLKLSEKDKHDFKMYCCDKNETMTSVIKELLVRTTREWRINNGEYTWEDLSDETKEALLDDETYPASSLQEIFDKADEVC